MHLCYRKIDATHTSRTLDYIYIVLQHLGLRRFEDARGVIRIRKLHCNSCFHVTDLSS